MSTPRPFDSLKVRPLQRATSRWANSIVDALNMIYGMAYNTVKFDDLKHLPSDIIPDADNVRSLGDPQVEWRAVYAHYGYFSDNVYVQGRRVLKDGDPVNISDIFAPAEEKIKEAVSGGIDSSSKIAQITDKIGSIRMDEYGNVGIIIAEPIDEYGFVKTSSQRTLESLFTPVYTRVTVPAPENVYGVAAILDTGGRPNLNVYVKLGGAGEARVEVSNDMVNWRRLDTITLTSAGEDFRIYQGVAFRYARVYVPTTGIDVEIEVAASR